MRALCTLALCALPTIAQAGAWTREAGQAFVRAGADAYVAPRLIQAGEVVDALFVGVQHSVYAEVGVLPPHPLHVAVRVPLSVGAVRFGDERWLGDGRGLATTIRMADLQIGVQTALLPKALRARAQLALAVDASVPLYDRTDVGVDHGYWAKWFARPGDGDVALTGTLRAGGGLSHGLWLEGGVGFRKRSLAHVGFSPSWRFRDQLTAELVFGGDLKKALLFLDAGAQIALGDDARTRSGVAAGVNGAVRLPHGFALHLRVGGEPWTKNAGQGAQIGLGLWWNAAEAGLRGPG